MAAKVYKNRNKIQKVPHFLPESICEVLSNLYWTNYKILHLTTPWPIYRLNEYLGSIDLYLIPMHLDGVLALSYMMRYVAIPIYLYFV